MSMALLNAHQGLIAKSAFTSRVASARAPAARVARSLQIRASVAGDGPLGDRWYPGAEVPKYLAEADLPGTYGFDPLRLGTNPDNLKWYAEAEKTNGRWAMAACAGILFTDAVGLPNWVNAGAEADLVLPLPTLIGLEVVIFALLEYKRYEGFKKTGKSGFLGSYPFDPLGQDSPAMAEREIKNARLAMLAFVGFASVYANRGMTPLQALNAHIADPANMNIFTTGQALPMLLATVALSIAPILIEARKKLDPTEDEFDPIPW
jgi:hypothetical protein